MATTKLEGTIWETPEFKNALKMVLKFEIQALLQRLATTGEESVVITASTVDGTASSMGSNKGEEFLDDADFECVKKKFLVHCNVEGAGSPGDPTHAADFQHDSNSNFSDITEELPSLEKMQGFAVKSENLDFEMKEAKPEQGDVKTEAENQSSQSSGKQSEEIKTGVVKSGNEGVEAGCSDGLEEPSITTPATRADPLDMLLQDIKFEGNSFGLIRSSNSEIQNTYTSQKVVSSSEQFPRLGDGSVKSERSGTQTGNYGVSAVDQRTNFSPASRKNLEQSFESVSPRILQTKVGIKAHTGKQQPSSVGMEVIDLSSDEEESGEQNTVMSSSSSPYTTTPSKIGGPMQAQGKWLFDPGVAASANPYKTFEQHNPSLLTPKKESIEQFNLTPDKKFCPPGYTMNFSPSQSPSASMRAMSSPRFHPGQAMASPGPRFSPRGSIRMPMTPPSPGFSPGIGRGVRGGRGLSHVSPGRGGLGPSPARAPKVGQSPGRPGLQKAKPSPRKISDTGGPTDFTELDAMVKCNKCEKIIKKSWMQAHQKIHMGVKPFKCHICDRDFGRSTHLRRHIATHSDAKDFVCTYCGKAFKFDDLLRRHIAKTHPDMVVPKVE